MGASEQRHAAGRFRRQLDVREAQLGLGLEHAAEVAQVRCQPRLVPRRSGGVGIGAVQGQRHHALALLEEAIEVMGGLGRIDQAQQLDVVHCEHRAVVGGAPADMVPAGGQPKAQSLVAAPGVLEVAHADDGVIDAHDVPHLRAPPIASDWPSHRPGS